MVSNDLFQQANTDIVGDPVSEMRPALLRLRDWAYPDHIDHASRTTSATMPRAGIGAVVNVARVAALTASLIE
jgi:hypothetical protein